MKTGITSISFRQNTPDEIIAAAAAAGLTHIEWGSDVHVPQSDTANAVVVARATRAAGLSVSSYGTYFKLGRDDPAAFPPYLDAAGALGTTVLRLWCGVRGSAETAPAVRGALLSDARRVAALAATRGMTLAFECHPNTMTDDFAATLAFLSEAEDGGDAPRGTLRMYFQPNQHKSAEYNLAAAHALAPLTENVHVFHWQNGEKLPLADAAPEWIAYARILGDAPVYLLEFMPDGRLDTLPREAAALTAILRSAAL